MKQIIRKYFFNKLFDFNMYNFDLKKIKEMDLILISDCMLDLILTTYLTCPHVVNFFVFQNKHQVWRLF